MSEVNFEEQKERIVGTLSTMFAYLGLTGEFRLEAKPNNRIGVKISSDDVGRIIGRRGQTLESLQLVLNRIVGRDDKEFPLVLLDIDGYADGEPWNDPGHWHKPRGRYRAHRIFVAVAPGA